MTTHEDEPRRLQINWVQTAGGALAAISSAVLLSTTGVAGTIIGAALGSVVVTVGNSVYSHYLAASKERVAAASIAAIETAARVRGRTRGRAAADTAANETPIAANETPIAANETPTAADETPTAADETPATDPAQAADETSEAATPVVQGPDWRDLFRGLPWKRLAAIAAAIFALTMGVILTFEALSGHAVSSYTGGTDKNGPRTSFGGSSDKNDTEPTKPTPTDPTATPTETTPTEEETETTPPEEETTTPPTTTAPTTTAPTTTAPEPTEPVE